MGRLSNGLYAGTTLSRHMAVDGGGWVMSIQVTPNGHWYQTTDTFACFHKDPGAAKWDLMFNPATTADAGLGEYDLDVTDSGSGTYGLGHCAAEPDCGFLIHAGRIWKFSGYAKTAGSIVQLTGFTPQTMNANGGDSRTSNHTVAVDPALKGVAAFGTPAGVFYTLDRTTVQQASDVPAPLGQGAWPKITVACDPAGPVDGQGRKQRWAAMVPGRGVYRTTTGLAGTWSLIAGSPTTVGMIRYGPDGALYVFNAGLWRLDAGSGTWSGNLWTDCAGIAFHPTNNNYLWLHDSAGNLRFSTNRGDASTAYAGRKLLADDVPYLGATNEYGATSGMAYDPTRNCLVWAMGIGVFVYANPATSNIAATQVTWQSETLGNAQLCVDDVRVVHAPGQASDGDVMIAVQDRGLFVRGRNEVDVQPAGHGPNYLQVLSHGSSIDYAPGAPAYRVGVVNSALSPIGNRSVFTSAQGGKTGTWQPTPGVLPDASYSGAVAVGGVGRFLLAPVTPDATGPYAQPGGNDIKHCFITTDGGVSYAPANIAGGRNLGLLYYAYTAKSRRVCHDPFEAGRYIVIPNGIEADTADNLAAIGVWDLKDDGSPAVRTRTTRLQGWVFDHWNVSLRPNPLRPNHFGYTCGPAGGSNPAPVSLWLTRDRFATVKALPGFAEVFDFDYGAAGAGEGYERLFIIGYRSTGSDAGQFGVWMVWNLDLDAATPTYQYAKIARYPDGWYDWLCRIAADKTMLGRAYVGRAGSGLSVIDYEARLRLRAA